jgi:hypothetical protein
MLLTAEEQKQLDTLSTKIQSLIDHPDQKLRRDEVLAFANSTVLEVRGSLAFLILRKDLSSRIVPELTLSEQQSILQSYWQRTLTEDPTDNDFVGGRYTSAGEILSRFGSLWKDPRQNQEAILAMKNWIGEIYRNGDYGLRTSVVQGVLEHLLQDPHIRKFYSDWKTDPILADAYKEATA